MSVDIRVRTSREYKKLYNDFRKRAVQDSHELFFIGACIGYRSGKRIPLGGSAEDRFWSSTITAEEWASYYAMFLESKEFDFGALVDDRVVIQAIEEYSNAGIGILLEELLSEYTRGDTADIGLDPGCSSELPKILLAYLFEQAEIC